MNNKYLSIMTIFLLGVMLCMGAVSAKAMKTNDFDDFEMDIPNDSNFVKQELEDDPKDSDMPLSVETYIDETNLIVLAYIDSPMFAGENNAAIYQAMFSTINPNINQSYESQDDELRIIEPIPKSDMNFPMVGLTSGNKTIMLFGQDIDLLKEMGHSVKFN